MTASRSIICSCVIAAAVALWACVASGADAVKASESRIQRLIKQLGDNNWAIRQSATEELKQIGLPARAALTEALRHPDFEVASRAALLLAELPWAVPAEDTPEIARLLEPFGRLDNASRSHVVDQLAGLDLAQSQPALMRIVEYDVAEEVAFAAAKVIEQRGDAKAALRVMSADLKVQRPATLRLLAWAQTVAKKPQAAALLEKAVALEKKRLSQLPGADSHDKRHLTELLLAQGREYARAGRAADCERVFREALESIPEQPEQVIGFFDALLAARRPQQVVEGFNKLKADAKQDARVIYQCAKAYGALGDEPRMRAAVAQALASSGDDQRRHFLVGQFLFDRDWDVWADLEFQRLLKLGPPDSPDAMNAHGTLLDIEGVRGNLLKAAEHCERFIQICEARNEGALISVDHVATVGLDDVKTFAQATRALLRYRQTGERGNVKELLEASLKAFPYGVHDTIEIYKLLVADNAQQEATERLETTRAFWMEQIRKNPTDVKLYNKVARLLVRTGQRLDEARQLAEKALALDPYNQMTMDILAEAHFRRGEVDKAIEWEKQALKLWPEHPYLKEQLKRFQAEKPAGERRGD